ncbi:MAG TPA: outer membrane beta-barrel protein, partial [Geopsychrobacteraceae bacterium]
MRNFLSISLLFLLCCTAYVGSAEAKLFPTLYATGGKHSFATEQDLSAGTLSGFKLSLDFEGGKNSNDFSLEGTFNQFSAENLDGGSDLDATVTRLDIIYPLMQKTDWRPFLTVGIGRMFFAGDDKPQDEDLVAYGVGLKHLLTEYLTLRAEWRHALLFNRDDGNIDNYEYTASIGYTFGKRKPRVKKPKPQPEPQPEPKTEPEISDDDDRDGVKNPVDRCPGTPAGIKVDRAGCAEQTPGRSTAPAQEVVPDQKPQALPAEETVVVAAVPAAAPALSEPAPLQEETIRQPAQAVAEQQETPPAYVLPELPTVIAIQTLPAEAPTLAVSAAETVTAPQPASADESPGAAAMPKPDEVVPRLPVATAAAQSAESAPQQPQQPSQRQPEYAASKAATGRIGPDAPAALFDQQQVADNKIKTAEQASESVAVAPASQQQLPVNAPSLAAVAATPLTAAVTEPAAAAAQERPARSLAEQFPQPPPVPTLATMTEQPSPAQAPPHAAAAEATAAPPAEQLKTEQLAAVPAIAGAAPSGAGAKAQAVPAAEPPAIPVCSGLPPHALLMLGKAGAELFQVPVAARQKQPKPFRADASVAKKSHIPAASFAFDVWRLA